MTGIFLNLRLMGYLHGLSCIAIIGRVLQQAFPDRHSDTGGDGDRIGNVIALVGLALLLVGSIGLFFARCIKATISREREFLADSFAVQFTRNPHGIAGALKKIGGFVAGSSLNNAHAEEVSHLFFGNGLGRSWYRFMTTHPPLPDRIKAVHPEWDGTFIPMQAGLPASGPAN